MTPDSVTLPPEQFQWLAQALCRVEYRCRSGIKLPPSTEDTYLLKLWDWLASQGYDLEQLT